MAYSEIIKNYPPYLLASDKRGFISLYFSSNHTGVDSICNLWDAPICPIFSGEVTSVKTDANLGNCLTYTSENGKVKVIHYHLREILVKKGDKVQEGKTLLGYEGTTGKYSTGKHLHTSIRIDNNLVNPIEYLRGDEELPLGETKEEKETDVNNMVRVVTKDLNLRSGYSVANKIVREMPIGTIFVVTKTKKLESDGSTWGKVNANFGDVTISGYCNISNTWSKEIS